MKKVLLTMALVLAGSAAYADYKCSNADGVKMTVIENHLTRVGDTLVTLEKNGQTNLINGQLESSDGEVWTKKVFSLYPHPEDSLTVVTKPKNCGRALCIDNLLITSASLKWGGNETFFSCK